MLNEFVNLKRNISSGPKTYNTPYTIEKLTNLLDTKPKVLKFIVSFISFNPTICFDDSKLLTYE